MLVLPGGLPGSETFRSTPAVLNLIRQCHSAGAYITFICAATIALVAAFEEPIKEARVTSHPSVMEEIKEKGWRYKEERVVISENVVTSRG
jgi:putative intracellular protease/amidase